MPLENYNRSQGIQTSTDTGVEKIPVKKNRLVNLMTKGLYDLSDDKGKDLLEKMVIDGIEIGADEPPKEVIVEMWRMTDKAITKVRAIEKNSNRLAQYEVELKNSQNEAAQELLRQARYIIANDAIQNEDRNADLKVFEDKHKGDRKNNFVETRKMVEDTLKHIPRYEEKANMALTHKYLNKKEQKEFDEILKKLDAMVPLKTKLLRYIRG